jgi:hypothetical protein
VTSFSLSHVINLTRDSDPVSDNGFTERFMVFDTSSNRWQLDLFDGKHECLLGFNYRCNVRVASLIYRSRSTKCIPRHYLHFSTFLELPGSPTPASIAVLVPCPLNMGIMEIFAFEPYIEERDPVHGVFESNVLCIIKLSGCAFG